MSNIIDRTVLFTNGIYKIYLCPDRLELTDGGEIVDKVNLKPGDDINEASLRLTKHYLNKGGYSNYMKILRVIDQVVDHKYLKMSEDTWLTYLKSVPAQYLRGLTVLIGRLIYANRRHSSWVNIVDVTDSDFDSLDSLDKMGL